MTTNTERRRGLAFGWVLLAGLWFAPAVWSEDTPPLGVRPETIGAGVYYTNEHNPPSLLGHRRLSSGLEDNGAARVKIVYEVQ